MSSQAPQLNLNERFSEEERQRIAAVEPIGAWMTMAHGAFREALREGGYGDADGALVELGEPILDLAIGLWARNTPALGSLLTRSRHAALDRAEELLGTIKSGRWTRTTPAGVAGRQANFNADENHKSMKPPAISITSESPRAAFTEFAAIVAKNARITDLTDRNKARLAAEAGALFASDLRDREDAWASMPLSEAIKAADVNSANLGTLAGTLVLQRSLGLLKYTFPLLSSTFTDFSAEPGQYLQTENTRIIVTPAVTEYDPTPDANGRPKGWAVVVPATAIDVPITLTKHVGIPMVLSVQTLASSIRKLFMEQTEAQLNALSGYFVAMATALMTATNYNAYKQVTDAGGATTSGSTTLTLASTAGVYPGQEVSGTGIATGAYIRSVTNSTTAEMTLAATATGSGLTITLGGGKVPTLYPTYAKARADFDLASLGEISAAFDINRVPTQGRSVMLNASYYQKLTADPSVNTFYAAIRSPEVVSKGMLPELNGLWPQKAPYFPTSNNRVGFAFHKAALILKSRLANDYLRALGSEVPIPGSVITVTDPDSGLSVNLTQRVDLQGGYAEQNVDVLLGAALGDRRAGLVLTSQ